MLRIGWLAMPQAAGREIRGLAGGLQARRDDLRLVAAGAVPPGREHHQGGHRREPGGVRPAVQLHESHPGYPAAGSRGRGVVPGFDGGFPHSGHGVR